MARILTRRKALAFSAAGVAAVAMSQRVCAGDTVDRSDLAGLFTEQGASGSFALYDAEADRMTLVDPRRAATRFVPASTFKITNSLIALETGVVKDEEEVIPYGGQPQPVKAWERDMGMREAIAMSNVPIYQEIARRVGLERYRAWLERLDYGNRQTGAVVDRFWLDGPLDISAVEQARFAARLARGTLPATERSQSIVRSILKMETAGSRTLYAKTGWWAAGTPKLGWWTGWVDGGGKVAAFSLNMDMPTAADGQKRIVVGKAILARLGVL